MRAPDWDELAQTLRRRTRRLVLVRGAALLWLVVVGLLSAVCLVDWAIHLDAAWIRLVLASGILIAAAVTAWRTLLRPLRAKLTEVDLARVIERRFPEWGDRLSSAAQFRAARHSLRLGSPELQQALTRDVDLKSAELDVERVLEPAPTRRLAAVAVAVCVLLLLSALWQPAATATALARLTFPLSDVQWPRTTELRFLNEDLQPLDERPQRTAAGEPLAMYLENVLGDLPEDAVVQLRLPGDRGEQRRLQTTVLRDAAGSSHEVGIAALTPHTGPIRFRAVGGDDVAMPWRTLEVVPPPALESVAITVTPPAYAAQEPRTLQGAGAIEALVGSRVQIEAQANKPLASAVLRREGESPQRMVLTGPRRRLEAEFVVEKAGRAWYWFDLTDEHGLGPKDAPRYELRGVADRKPTVFIEEPAGDITVTPDAQVPLRIVARDDLGVKELRLVHSQTDAAPASVPLEMSGTLPTDEAIETVWSLVPLGLSAGDRLTYHAEAVDACDLPQSADLNPQEQPRRADVEASAAGSGQVGISIHRHIEILSSTQKRRELAARQMGVLDVLKDAKSRQARALETTAGLRIQSELADALQADDLDLLKQTELEQQHIKDRLADARSGAAREIETLRQELQRNQIDDPQMASRLEELAADLATLSGELLPTIEQSLARARKLSQPSASAGSDGDQRTPSESGARPAGGAEPQQQLRKAEQAQSVAVGLLEDATRRLGGWQQQYEVTSELDGIVADQSDVQQETKDVGLETLTTRPEALTQQQQADLARLADRQRRLASRLQAVLERGASDAQPAEPPSAAVEAMNEALRQLARRGTAGHMHQAAESLKRNDIARTAQVQQQVLSDLRDFGQMLQPGEADAAQTLLSQIEQHAEEVETLRKRQEQLSREAQQAMAPTADPDRPEQLERLIREQEKLAVQAEQLTRQLRRQQSGPAAQTAARAARRMREAQQGIEREQPQETANRQQEALDDLTQLADELAERRQDIEQELVRRQIEQLGDQLQEIADQQAELVETTASLDARQRERGSWSRTLRKELNESANAQAQLAGRLDELQGTLGEYPVLDLSLQHAAEPMRQAVERLERSDAGQATLERQRTAHQRLLAIIDAMRSSSEPQSRDAPLAGRQPQQSGPQAQQPPRLLGTQLRLLRHLQADVQERTAALTAQLRGTPLPQEEAAAARNSLARDQLRIAELTRSLLEQFIATSPAPAQHDPEEETQP